MANRNIVVYIHGKGGSPAEAEHYRALFSDADVVGFDYISETPWEAKEEFAHYFEAISTRAAHIRLIANSIGAYYAMCALSETHVEKAYFISPIVDMEGLILGMMRSEMVSEAELMEKGVISTSFGEELSWAYLSWVRANPVDWKVPTEILYGEKDVLQSAEVIRSFASRVGAGVTAFKGGEHWFHTEAQMAFLDDWLRGLIANEEEK